MADDPSIPPRIIDIDDLRPGDIVLLTAVQLRRGGVDPIGESVRLFDGTDYSHAVVLEHFVKPRQDFTCLSANQRLATEEHEYVSSGVNRLSLRWLNFSTDERYGRGLLVLRHKSPEVIAAALDEGPCWVDSTNRDPSDFGWEQIGLSAAYSWSRHLNPGCGRSLFQRFVRDISVALLPEQRPDGDPQCGAGPGDPPQRWDCCHFVDHLFSAPGQSLGTVEADPEPRGRAWDLLEQFIELWAGELFSRLCDGKVATAGDEEELDRFVDAVMEGEVHINGRVQLKDLVRALRCIKSGPLPTEPYAAEAMTGAVWPPFSSPRLLWHHTSDLEVVGIIPAEGLYG